LKFVPLKLVSPTTVRAQNDTSRLITEIKLLVSTKVLCAQPDNRANFVVCEIRY